MPERGRAGPAAATEPPLILDFDGTLHHKDLSLLGLNWLRQHKPRAAARAVLLAGLGRRKRAKLLIEKHALAAAYLPPLQWDARVRQAALAESARGREVWVVTGSPQRWVEQLLRAAALPWPVLGTVPEARNCIGRHKAALLVQKFGEKGFDYAGNSRADLSVWPHARQAWLANTSARVAELARRCCPIAREFPKPSKKDAR